MSDFERQPLDVSQLPANLQKHAQPDAPMPAKMMAARGMVPAPPEQTITLLYQLSFDAGDKVALAAVDSLEDMPPDILTPAVTKARHAGMLDWIAEVRGDDAQIAEAVVRNQATHDQTVVALAAGADRNLADIIATNQVRVLREPEIIEELYKNPHVGSSTIDALIELAQRNEVELKGLPGLQEALKSGRNLNDAKSADPDAFDALLGEEAARIEAEKAKLDKLDDDSLTRSERERLREEIEAEEAEEAEEEQRSSRGNLYSQISDMSTAQKIRLATVGSREAIKILVREQNKLVHMAAIKSPRIKKGDVIKLSANKSLPDGVIEYIANNRDYTQAYEVQKNLVLNPKTPLKDTLRFLNHLRNNDLRDVSRSRNIPHQVSRMAKNLLNKRQGR